LYIGPLVNLDSFSVQEETEFRSDGTKKVIRPSQLTLARVSVLRGGDGATSGKPFIDDYIHTTDTVVDYLTEYSGIKCM
jgi:PAB-dependent poly(A)-specific ribonuclease subunit 2